MLIDDFDVFLCIFNILIDALDVFLCIFNSCVVFSIQFDSERLVAGIHWLYVPCVV